MIKYCSECGAKVETGAHYCGECGAKIETNNNIKNKVKSSDYLFILNIISFFLSIVALAFTIKNFAFLKSAMDYVIVSTTFFITISYIFGFILVPICLNIISYIINMYIETNSQNKLIKQITFSLNIIIFCLLILQIMILLFS